MPATKSPSVGGAKRRESSKGQGGQDQGQRPRCQSVRGGGLVLLCSNPSTFCITHPIEPSSASTSRALCSQKLVKLIFEKDMFKESMESFNLDVKKVWDRLGVKSKRETGRNCSPTIHNLTSPLSCCLSIRCPSARSASSKLPVDLRSSRYGGAAPSVSVSSLPICYPANHQPICDPPIKMFFPGAARRRRRQKKGRPQPADVGILHHHSAQLRPQQAATVEHAGGRAGEDGHAGCPCRHCPGAEHPGAGQGWRGTPGEMR